MGKLTKSIESKGKRVEAKVATIVEDVLATEEAKRDLYGVDKKTGACLLPIEARFVIRCKCGALFCFCAEFPESPKGTLSAIKCKKCKKGIPFAPGSLHVRYDAGSVLSIEEDLKRGVAARKAKTPEPVPELPKPEVLTTAEVVGPDPSVGDEE